MVNRDKITQGGLRIIGDENTPNAERHRSIYCWAAVRLKEMGVLGPVLDFGCGAGYGTRILYDAGIVTVGYDPAPEVRKFALQTYRVPVLRHAIDGNAAVVAIEVLEHLEAPVRDSIAYLHTLAPIVIGSVPYMEQPGNPHHKQFNLWGGSIPSSAETWALLDATGEIVPFEARGDGDKVGNLLFVVRRCTAYGIGVSYR